MQTPEDLSGVATQRCHKSIIVHPEFAHTLPKPVPPPIDSLGLLPSDILRNIASRLVNARELCAYARLCRSCRQAADDSRLWRRLCNERFNTPLVQLKHGLTWKEVYRFHHEFLFNILVYKRPETLNLGGIFVNNPLNIAVF